MIRLLFRPLLIAALVTLALVGCAPRQQTSGAVPAALLAIMNAPAQSVLPGSADGVQELLQRDTSLPFSYVSAFTMRFQETHSDMFLSRAAPSAARIARSHGADLAVMVGAGLLEREVTIAKNGASRRIDVSLALEAQVVDPSNDAVVQVLRTRTHQGSRLESTAAELVDVEQDTTVLALRDRAVPELTAALKAELPYLMRSLLIGSSGG